MKATPEDVAKILQRNSDEHADTAASMKATPEDVAKIDEVLDGVTCDDVASMKATPEDVAKNSSPLWRRSRPSRLNEGHARRRGEARGFRLGIGGITACLNEGHARRRGEARNQDSAPSNVTPPASMKATPEDVAKQAELDCVGDGPDASMKATPEDVAKIG